MGRWFRLVGILASGMSLFSLAQKYWKFGLSPLMADVVSYYKEMVYPIVGPIAQATRSVSWLVWDLSLEPDVILIYLVGVSTYALTLFSLEGVRENLTKPRTLALALGAILYWPITVILGPIIHATLQYIYGDLSQGMIPLFKEWLKQVLFFVIAFLAYFALNAYGPSLPSL